MTSPIRFALSRPRSLSEALALKARFGSNARFIAGGTDLMPRLRAGALSVEQLISVRRIEGFAGTSFDAGDGLSIGAGARISDIGAIPEVRDRYPALAHACAVMATTQIRNMGTVAGNLANGSPCADTSAPLLVHDAMLEIAKAGGTRRRPLDGFFHGARAVDLAEDEVLVAIHVPTPAAGARSGYMRISARSHVDMAAVGVAGLLTLDDAGSISSARLAVSAAAPTPVRCTDAEALLTGASPSKELFDEAGEACRGALAPIDDIRATAAYRRHVAGVLAKRVLAECAERAARGGTR